MLWVHKELIMIYPDLVMILVTRHPQHGERLALVCISYFISNTLLVDILYTTILTASLNWKTGTMNSVIFEYHIHTGFDLPELFYL